MHFFRKYFLSERPIRLSSVVFPHSESKLIQQFQRDAGACQKCPKVLGGRIDFFELALDLKFAVFIREPLKIPEDIE